MLHERASVQVCVTKAIYSGLVLSSFTSCSAHPPMLQLDKLYSVVPLPRALSIIPTRGTEIMKKPSSEDIVWSILL